MSVVVLITAACSTSGGSSARAATSLVAPTTATTEPTTDPPFTAATTAPPPSPAVTAFIGSFGDYASAANAFAGSLNLYPSAPDLLATQVSDAGDAMQELNSATNALTGSGDETAVRPLVAALTSDYGVLATISSQLEESDGFDIPTTVNRAFGAISDVCEQGAQVLTTEFDVPGPEVAACGVAAGGG